MDKSPDAFRTISEVADWLGTPTHVLRFWESRFSQIKPVKRAGGRRYYRPGDMALLGGIKKLLHDDGLTIRGVQKILREQGVKYVSSLSLPVDDEAEVEEAGFAQDVPTQPARAEVVQMPGAAAPPQEDPDAPAPVPETASDDAAEEQDWRPATPIVEEEPETWTRPQTLTPETPEAASRSAEIDDQPSHPEAADATIEETRDDVTAAPGMDPAPQGDWATTETPDTAPGEFAREDTAPPSEPAWTPPTAQESGDQAPVGSETPSEAAWRTPDEHTRTAAEETAIPAGDAFDVDGYDWSRPQDDPKVPEDPRWSPPQAPDPAEPDTVEPAADVPPMFPTRRTAAPEDALSPSAAAPPATTDTSAPVAEPMPTFARRTEEEPPAPPPAAPVSLPDPPPLAEGPTMSEIVLARLRKGATVSPTAVRPIHDRLRALRDRMSSGSGG